MNVYRSIENIPFDTNSVLTIGTFDGIHLGHQKILESVKKSAEERSARSICVTFYPHPQKVVSGGRSSPALLTPIEEKIELIAAMGLDCLLVIPFTRQFSEMNPEEFIEDVLVKKIGATHFVIGYNHAFGRDRTGGGDLLKTMGLRFGFTVEVVDPVYIDDTKISSTGIRNALIAGNVRLANKMLGRNYSLSGIVGRGKNRGRVIGFPTANIVVRGEGKLIPADGVYAVIVHLWNKIYTGMANIGYRPTLDGREHEIEVNIHEFSADLYGEILQIDFVDRIRDEKHFDSVDDLIVQIKKDREKSKKLLSDKLLEDLNEFNERGKG